MFKYYIGVFSILITMTYATDIAPGKYYSAIDFEVGGCIVEHSPWCLEKAADESPLSVVSQKQKQEEFRNLASASVTLKIVQDGDVVYQQTHDLKASYRNYRDLRTPIDPKIFISTEYEEFLSYFKNIQSPLETDPLYTYVTAWETFDNTRTAELNKGIVDSKGTYSAERDDFNKYIQNAFSIDVPTAGRKKHFDDTEQQIIRHLEQEFPALLGKWLQKYCAINTEKPTQKVSLMISVLIHTRMDPCPYCLNRMWQYFTCDFPKATKQAILEASKTTKFDVDRIYLFPVISSRVEYRPHPRMRLPWSKMLNLDHFTFSEEGLTLDPPEGYGLILYVVPYSELWEAREAKLEYHGLKN